MSTRDPHSDPGFAKGRRRFLNACLILGASGADPASCVTVSRLLGTGVPQAIGKRRRMVQLRHTVADFGNADAYYRFRTTLAVHAINPWERSWMEGLDDELPDGFEALVEVNHEAEEMAVGTLLEFSEWRYSDPDINATGNELSFDEWLCEFRPKSRDDFLMVLPLYHLYQRSGEVIPKVQATPDPWLDAMLKNTRGMLLWTQQWIELFRVISNIDRQGASRLFRDYMRSCPDASVALNQTRYFATGQSLMQIIKERSPSRLPFGSPDYLVGDWLHQYWGCSEPTGEVLPSFIIT